MIGKKYSINDFYVAELHISYKLGNVLTHPADFKEYKEYYELLSKGAIRYDSSRIDWASRRNYNCCLAIFLKTSKGLLCIHNGKIYELKGVNYLKNPEPITKYLFAYDIDKFEQINIKTALSIFNKLFGSKKVPFFTSYDDTFKLEDFYVGTLNVFSQTSYIDNKSQSANVAERMMLSNRGYYNGFHGYDETYDKFKCLFLNQKEGLLNLGNNVVYGEGILTNNEYSYPYYGSKYYEFIHKLSDYLTTTEKEKYRVLTLEKAINVYNKKIK